MRTEVQFRDKVLGAWNAGSLRCGDGSRPSSDRPHFQNPLKKVDAASGDTDRTPLVALSFTAGCTESEVYRLFRTGVSGFPLGKDGKNG